MKLGPAHERVKDALRRHETELGHCILGDAKLAALLKMTEREVCGLIADLDGAGRIRIARSGKGRSITVYADRFDDSDEISRRIDAAKGLPPTEMEQLVQDVVAHSAGVRAEIASLSGKPEIPRELRAKPSSVYRLSAQVAPKAAPVSRQNVAEPQPEAMGITPAAATNCRSSRGNTVPTKPRFAAPLGRPPSIENRHPDELRIDDSYQRSTDTGPSRALIERIAKGWDWRMCLPLVVSKRGDELYVIDGQHRLAAAKMRGDIQWLPCCVAVYGDVADEAAMFVAMNRQRRAINRLDDFHAAQAGGNEEALAIAKLVTSVGFTVSRRTGSATWVPGEVAFTSAIGKVRRKHGDKVVTDALAMMAAAFPGERLVAGSSIFTALCAIMVSPPAGFERPRLADALRTFDMKGWAEFLTNAKGGDDRASKLRQMLLAAYEDVGKAA